MTYSIFHSTRTLQTALEILAVLALIVAWWRPRVGCRLFVRAEWHFRRFAAKRRHAIAAAAFFPMLVRVLILPLFPIPHPRVHDEFSYLLLSDTLAHGRVTNPTPPSWRHFETEYELVTPTYASQYEPGQGLALASGQVVLGNAWWGVWLSTGLMCAALCWALGFVVPLRWAFFGSLLAALQFGVFGFWMNSYFGGAVPAIGGALVLGSLVRRHAVSSGVLAAGGVIIVLASRPVEGIIWLVVTVCVMALRRGSRGPLLSLVAFLSIGLGVLGWYNARITGSVLKSPYALYRQDYGTPQSYWWQAPVVVTHFDHPELAANYQDQLRYWQRRSSAAALWNSTWHRLRDFWRFFIGPFLTPAALFALFSLKRRKLRPWLWVSGVFILDHATYHAWYPQQSASETILIVWLGVEGWRRLRIWQPRPGVGLAISRNLTAGFATAFVLLIVGLAALPAVPNSWTGFRRIWDTMNTAPNRRETAIRRLEGAPGKHLVFVRYSADHPWYDEWVFNGADMTASRIVFARMCTPESDRALADSMRDRDVWIASPDEDPMIARATPAELLLASGIP
jgi:hypothetical protein